MKFIILLSILALVVAEETYSTENDDLDIDAIVASQDKLESYYNCFIDNGSCDAIQDSFKKDLAEAVREACAKCTTAQRHILKRFIEGLKEKLPQDYEGFKTKYDPENKYFTALEKAIANA